MYTYRRHGCIVAKALFTDQKPSKAIMINVWKFSRLVNKKNKLQSSNTVPLYDIDCEHYLELRLEYKASQ